MELPGPPATRYVALEWRVDFPDRLGRVQQDLVLTASGDVFAMALMKGVTSETADRVVLDLPRRIEQVRAESVE